MIASFEISNADSVGVKKSTLVEKIWKFKIDFNSSSRRNYNLDIFRQKWNLIFGEEFF